MRLLRPGGREAAVGRRGGRRGAALLRARSASSCTATTSCRERSGRLMATVATTASTTLTTALPRTARRADAGLARAPRRGGAGPRRRRQLALQGLAAVLRERGEGLAPDRRRRQRLRRPDHGLRPEPARPLARRRRRGRREGSSAAERAWRSRRRCEVELAQTIARLVPSMEVMRFVVTGTEATMMALRTARAFTGRSLVARFEGHYHGQHDAALVSVAHVAGSEHRPEAVADGAGITHGVLDEVVVLPWNDIDHGRAGRARRRRTTSRRSSSSRCRSRTSAARSPTRSSCARCGS